MVPPPDTEPLMLNVNRGKRKGTATNIAAKKIASPSNCTGTVYLVCFGMVRF